MVRNVIEKSTDVAFHNIYWKAREFSLVFDDLLIARIKWESFDFNRKVSFSKLWASFTTRMNWGQFQGQHEAKPASKPSHILHTFLEHNQQALSAKERMQRTFIVNALNTIAEYWVRSVALKYHIPLPKRNEELSRVLPFGSHALGTDVPGSDVDVVVLTPSFISRNENFFGTGDQRAQQLVTKKPDSTCMLEILREVRKVKHIVALRHAYAPVIRFLFHGVNVDMQCAPLAVHFLPFPMDVLNDSLLRYVDPGTNRSASGVRTDQIILRSLSDCNEFCTLLRTVKLWAKRRFIYSSIYGYLGGISWTLMTARTCRVYEGYSGIQLLALFFKTYSAWQWAPFPSWKPVRLTCERNEGIWTGWDSWIPPSTYYQNPMQIICPVFPYTNSSYNVCRSTHKVIMEELRRADDIMNQVTKACLTTQEGLSELVELYPFHDSFQFYLIIEISARGVKEHREWQAFVESRVRRLIYELEQTSTFDMIRPFPEVVKSASSHSNQEISHFFIGIGKHTSSTEAEEIILNQRSKQAILGWEAMINSWKLKTTRMQMFVRFSKRCQDSSEKSTVGGRSDRKRKRIEYEGEEQALHPHYPVAE
ncbi:Poly(A) polymerase [Gracilariopsis chorda]|uniref:polynucleotide adenylyltransferase n=1 Tax=Gracilariopsis chorda TaxID=448386 RepID=A0A2V3IN25_9FLOR|nr:Poly(A) polymerase [Gracilariopsis chorda]|eukprot:PXF43472.1 Poly(A) polymerase [Gracilariopsis chorda]